MENILILTGWGLPEYPAAAAALLRALGNRANRAEVTIRGASQQKLADELAMAADFAEVFVLGVGLTENLDRIGESLAMLAERKVKTSWISSCEMPADAAKALKGERGFAEKKVCKGAKSLVDATADVFGVSTKGLTAVLAKSATGAAVEYRHLFKACGFMHRNRGNDFVYGAAITALSLGTAPAAWDNSLKSAVEEYRRCNGRELEGRSHQIQSVKVLIDKAAKYARARVMILGENGTGKETVAQEIHAKSSRSHGEFVSFNCASVTPNLLEDRFFGHVAGAFTGATKDKPGLFDKANGGTLFLDEIGDLPLEAQGVLLRVLQEGTFMRVGGDTLLSCDVRLITATNRNLPKMVREGKFRMDLFHRLSTLQIQMPSLSERVGDIKIIADSYWFRLKGEHLTEAQQKALASYSYPGNVRELLNLLDRAEILEYTDFDKLISQHVRLNRGLTEETAEENDENEPEDLESVTRAHVSKIFKRYGQNLTETCKALGISRNTVKKYL